MLNTAQYTISIVHYFSRKHLLQNAALVICLSLLPASLPTPSQLYGAGGSLCKVSRSRGVSYPPQALHSPWQGGSTCQEKELRGIDTFSCPEAQKRNPNATLLAKPMAHIQLLPTSTLGGTESSTGTTGSSTLPHRMRTIYA